MKRSIIRKAGTLFLSTAAGCCFLSADAAWGQNPTSSAIEIQRRLQEMYARDGRHQPASPLKAPHKTNTKAQTAAQPLGPAVNPPLVPLEPPRPAIREVAPAALPPEPAPVAEKTPEVPATPSSPKKGLLSGLFSSPQQPSPKAVPPSHFPGHHAKEPAANEPFNPFEVVEAPAPKPLPRTDLPEVKPKAALPAITPGPSSNPNLAQVPGAKPQNPMTPPAVVPQPIEAPKLEPKIPRQPIAESVQSAKEKFEMPILSETAETQAATSATVEFTPAFPDSPESLEHAEATPLEAGKQPATAPPFANPEPTAELPLVASRATASSQARPVSVEFQNPGPATIPVEGPAPVHVGLNGCCPVTLRNARTQIPGRPELASHWQGAVYHFTSTEAKQEFESHPEFYAPAQAGLDVTQAAIQGQQPQGSLEHAVWYRRQLYLFRDAAALKNFTANPDYYAKNQ